MSATCASGVSFLTVDPLLFVSLFQFLCPFPSNFLSSVSFAPFAYRLQSPVSVCIRPFVYSPFSACCFNTTYFAYSPFSLFPPVAFSAISA